MKKSKYYSFWPFYYWFYLIWPSISAGYAIVSRGKCRNNQRMTWITSRRSKMLSWTKRRKNPSYIKKWTDQCWSQKWSNNNYWIIKKIPKKRKRKKRNQFIRHWKKEAVVRIPCSQLFKSLDMIIQYYFEVNKYYKDVYPSLLTTNPLASPNRNCLIKRKSLLFIKISYLSSPLA